MPGARGRGAYDASDLRIVMASRNQHKVRELARVLAPHRLELLPESIELPPEDGDTFAENALIKARAVAAALGAPALADDSGIVVDALGGAPGVRSARYAGEAATDEQNLHKLLDEMNGTDDRRAAYVCVLALVDPAGSERLFEGRCEGRLAHAPRGSGGFGYDPAFLPDDLDGPERTMAEIAPAEKDAISHRGRAARSLAAALRETP
jgi:XTP/dITP diphosphohydrolase